MAAAASPTTTALLTPMPTRELCASPTVPMKCTATRSRSSSLASKPPSSKRYRRRGKDEEMRVIIGVPKEVKTHEYRVGLTPTSVRELVALGHQVVVETNAGAGIGAADAAYEKAGARIGEPWKEAELIVKVKEPQREERKKIAEGHVPCTDRHLAPDRAQAEERS